MDKILIEKLLTIDPQSLLGLGILAFLSYFLFPLLLDIAKKRLKLK
jgi:hypothetical protein